MKHMIAFRGLNNIFEDSTMKKWCQKHDYKLRIFNYFEVADAIDYVTDLDSDHIEILGYSRGAVSAYDLAKKTPDIHYTRMLTVGSYHTVTSSFGNARPKLKNVGVHLNYIEKHQQPKGFFNNPINISLGECSHFKAVEKTLSMIDNNIQLL